MRTKPFNFPFPLLETTTDLGAHYCWYETNRLMFQFWLMGKMNYTSENQLSCLSQAESQHPTVTAQQSVSSALFMFADRALARLPCLHVKFSIAR